MKNDDIQNALNAIGSKEDLASFIEILIKDLQENGHAWDNATLDRYLEAGAAWLHDMDGYFSNMRQPAPEQPSWKLIGEILFAAAIYE